MSPSHVIQPTIDRLSEDALVRPERFQSVERRPFALAAACLMALVLALATWASLSYFDSIDHLSRGSLPGVVEFAASPGRVVVYDEGHADASLGELDIRVTGPNGSAVHLEPFPYHLRYDVGTLVGHAVAVFDATAAGRYKVTSRTVETGGRLAVGTDLGALSVLTAVAVIAALLTCLVAVVFGVHLALGRADERRRRGLARGGVTDMPTLPVRRHASMLHRCWADRRLGLVFAIALAVAAGLIAAWLTPRGPATAPQALASMAAGVLVGVTAGLVMGSRWSIVVAPAVFMIAFEVARLGTNGPTVDAINLGSMYGIIAFTLGRALHGLLALAPMALGARYGVELAARLGRDSTAALGLAGWGLSGVGTIGLVALAIAIAVPATTAPIVGSDGGPVPGSVAELATVRIGGHDQVMLIRGRSTRNPVLLYLAGGPGGTDLGAMRADTSLEEHFVVVAWDQRGTGKSYAALDPTSTFTVGQMVADTIEVTNYLRARFGQDRIYLVGNSWGTFLGVLAVQRHPELYHAYVGTGQMVSTTETDRMFWEDSLAWAERTGETALAATLRRNGPPPYDDLLAYEPAIAPEHDFNPYPELDPGKEMPFNLFVPENSLMDKLNGMRGFLDTFSVLYPQLRDIDLRTAALRLDVPVYLVIGRHEARGRAVPANEWYDLLQAPSKQWITFEHSGHRPVFEEPAVFASLMARVIDETSGSQVRASNADPRSPASGHASRP